MIRDTTDPLLARLAQEALQEQGLYEGQLDGAWGAVSEAAFAVYRNYTRYDGIAALKETLTPAQALDLARFVSQFKINQQRYNAVSGQAKVPCQLVAALHWRESGGDFTTYLHNGDPLGRPTTDDPKGILFTAWEPAAIDALKREARAYELSGIEAWTKSLECMCVFAEAFNGEGYDEMKPPVPDPYVLAGTSGYLAGKFVRDGIYSRDAVDEQIGVLVMLRALL